MKREEITDYLRQVPDLINEVIHGLSDDKLRHRPSADEWSLLEVCCHLRDAADFEGRRIRRLVEEDKPTLEPYDQEVLAQERNYQGDDPRRVRIALRAFWGGLAYQLEELSDAEWERGGTHREVGSVSVRSRAQAELEHAEAHLAQMRAIRERL